MSYRIQHRDPGGVALQFPLDEGCAGLDTALPAEKIRKKTVPEFVVAFRPV
ncbi:MAG TPA: hypothetical protein VL486_00065 [Verrucomicrobiae bacterium]|nr:hypothetical protein [Verrucomicrobiae bacterium]